MSSTSSTGFYPRSCSTMRLTALLTMAARVVVPKDYRYGTNRPWTAAAKRLNPPGKKRRKVFVEPIAPEDWSVFRGDTVSSCTPNDLFCRDCSTVLQNKRIYCKRAACSLSLVAIRTVYALVRAIVMQSELETFYQPSGVFYVSSIFSQVEILAGKDKGKQGKVIQVFRHRNWVILEGLNTVRKSN